MDFAKLCSDPVVIPKSMYFSTQPLKLKKPLFLVSVHVSSICLTFLVLFISHSLKTKREQINKEI